VIFFKRFHGIRGQKAERVPYRWESRVVDSVVTHMSALSRAFHTDTHPHRRRQIRSPAHWQKALVR